MNKNIELKPEFHKMFSDEVNSQLSQMKKSGAPIMKEAVARSVQNALTEALAKTKTAMSSDDREILASELRNKVSSICISKDGAASNILANVRTADIKERATDTSVVRLKITLKEEGLEWSTKANESGGVIRTLQPE